MAYDDINIPGIDSPYKLTNLSRIDFLGLPEFEIIYEQSPRLVGVRAVGVTYKERYGAMVLHIAKSGKQEFLHFFNPSRFFALGEPFIYNSYSPGGNKIYGNDGEVLARTKFFTSNKGNFKDLGGLRSGSWIKIDGTNFQIEEVLSDTVLILTCVIANTASNLSYSFITGMSRRRIDFNIKGGLEFIRTKVFNTYTQEILNIVAPYPFWYGEEQFLQGASIGELLNKDYPVTYPEGNIYDIREPITEVKISIRSDLFVKPIIKLYGKSTKFVMSNLTSDTSISYNRFIDVNEVVVINLELMTASSYTSSYNAENDIDGVNVFKFIEGDRSIFGFDPHVITDIRFETDNKGVNVFAEISWYNKYLGS